MIPMPNDSKMSELGGISGLAELACRDSDPWCPVDS